MNKFPWDFIIHLILCFIPVWSLPAWQMIVTVSVVAMLLEYEQKSQVWYDSLSWKDYFWLHALRDLIADAIGITLGALI